VTNERKVRGGHFGSRVQPVCFAQRKLQADDCQRLPQPIEVLLDTEQLAAKSAQLFANRHAHRKASIADRDDRIGGGDQLAIEKC
jgi:hypothetical protein